jgi:hypothetical protein
MMGEPCIPDLETRKRLLKNLRHTRLEMAQLNLEMDEIIALLEGHNRQQRLERLKQSQVFNQSRNDSFG